MDGELNISRTALSSVLQFGAGAGLGMMIDGVFPPSAADTPPVQDAIEVGMQVAVAGVFSAVAARAIVDQLAGDDGPLDSGFMVLGFFSTQASLNRKTRSLLARVKTSLLSAVSPALAGKRRVEEATGFR